MSDKIQKWIDDLDYARSFFSSFSERDDLDKAETMSELSAWLNKNQDTVARIAELEAQLDAANKRSDRVERTDIEKHLAEISKYAQLALDKIQMQRAEIYRLKGIEQDAQHYKERAEQAEAELEITNALNNKMSKILSRIAIVLHGREMENGLWSWHDLAELATALRERAEQAEREVSYLRLYGNKDCTAQADEAMEKEDVTE